MGRSCEPEGPSPIGQSKARSASLASTRSGEAVSTRRRSKLAQAPQTAHFNRSPLATAIRRVGWVNLKFTNPVRPFYGAQRLQWGGFRSFDCAHAGLRSPTRRIVRYVENEDRHHLARAVTHSLLPPRLAQTVEEPLVVSDPRRIVGQRQLLRSELGNTLGGDAGESQIALQCFMGFGLLPGQ